MRIKCSFDHNFSHYPVLCIVDSLLSEDQKMLKIWKMYRAPEIHLKKCGSDTMGC